MSLNRRALVVPVAVVLLFLATACGSSGVALAQQACSTLSVTAPGVESDGFDAINPAELDRDLISLDTATNQALAAAAENPRWDDLATSYSTIRDASAILVPIYEEWQRTGVVDHSNLGSADAFYARLDDALVTARSQCAIADATS